MEIEKVAARAAKRKNNKMAKRYPLFAELFATTAETEKERILRQRERAEIWKNKMAELSRKKWKEGLWLKEIARENIPEHIFRKQEEFWEKTFENCDAEHDGHRLADYWWTALKGTKWAEENCPNNGRHSDPSWWKPYFNFLLEKYVETMECPTCGMERPKDLEETKCR